MVVDTKDGRVHVRWDPTAQATPHGQIVFFAEFLATAGAFDRWAQDCPLTTMGIGLRPSRATWLAHASAQFPRP